jgi:hypothetical protein
MRAPLYACALVSASDYSRKPHSPHVNPSLANAALTVPSPDQRKPGADQHDKRGGWLGHRVLLRVTLKRAVIKSANSIGSAASEE